MTAPGIIPQNNPAPIFLTFSLRFAPMGKMRPRVTRFGTFMPKEYDAWRDLVRWQVRSQVPAAILPRLPLVCRLAWACTYSLPRAAMACDGDNADGALWDALQVPPSRRDKKTGQLRGGGWGLIANDKQFKAWIGKVVDGPTCITFTITEIP